MFYNASRKSKKNNAICAYFFAKILLYMEKDILSEVIAVEKEIHERLELERMKSRKWLEDVKKESEEEMEREEKNINESLNKSVENSKIDAEVKAEEIVKQADAKAVSLAKLNDETLGRIVGKQIARILPGLSHDS